MKKLVVSLCSFWMLLLSSYAAFAFATVDAIIGQPTVKRANTSVSSPLLQGQQLSEGDLVETNAHSHVFVKANDGSYLFIRPNTRLYFEVYQYDAAQPKDTRIRIHLLSGVYRSITGKELEQGKEGYRLNTPLVAIGIRGTDYTVHADERAFSLSVISGGVIASPYTDSCNAKDFGGCQSGVLLMSDEGKNTLLTLHAEDMTLRKVSKLDSQGKEPDKIVPPSAQELEKANAANNEIKLQSNLHWGRWGAFAKPDSADSIASLLDKGQLIGLNEVYGMARSQVPLFMPEKGQAHFTLEKSEVVLLDKTGNLIGSVLVSDPKLMVDFGKQTFETALGLTFNKQRVNFYAQGNILDGGHLIASRANATGSLEGALAGSQGEQAGYVFRQPFLNNVSAVGITQWGR